MEPLSPRIQRSSDYLIAGLYAVCVLIPLSWELSRYLFELDFSLLSPLFFKILGRSILFALGEATLSLLAVALFVFFLGALSLFLRAHPACRKLLEGVGLLSFSLSPTLVALSLVFSFSFFSETLLSGLLAIVLCHFLINAAFFASLFLRRLDRFFSSQGDALALYLSSLGASKIQYIRIILFPVFKEDLRAWGPQVFLWSFMSFAPVVLLSSGPHQNTPELLLFYSLLNDPSGTRMLIIFCVTASLSYLLNRYLFIGKSGAGQHDESHSGAFLAQSSPLFTLFIGLICLLLFLPYLFSFFAPLFTVREISLQELLPTLLPTVSIVLGSFLFSFTFGVLSALGSRELRVVSYCNFLSAPMILVGSMGLLGQVQGPFRYPMISLGAVLAVLPWFHRQIRSVQERLPQDLKLLSLSLGMRNSSYFWNFLWPQLRPQVVYFSLLVSLWTLGEYTFSKALLNRNETLALFIEENLRRYSFDQASLGLALSLFISAIVVTLLLWKGRKRVEF